MPGFAHATVFAALFGTALAQAPETSGPAGNFTDIAAKTGVIFEGVASHTILNLVGYKRAHFGLGADLAATLIEIRWPIGVVQELANVQADQMLKTDEPANSSGTK